MLVKVNLVLRRLLRLGLANRWRQLPACNDYKNGLAGRMPTPLLNLDGALGHVDKRFLRLRQLALLGFGRAMALLTKRDDVRRQAKFLQQFDLVIADVDFPPTMLDRARRRIFVMIVMPTLTDRQ